MSLVKSKEAATLAINLNNQLAPYLRAALKKQHPENGNHWS